MRIGELAKAAGVNVQTIRFYERRRLLPAPARSSAGYRAYSAEVVRLVQFIKAVQAHGYSLDEIRELLSLGKGTHVAAIVRDRAEKKLRQIEAEISRLTGIHEALTHLVQHCASGHAAPDCLVLRGAVTPAQQTPNASSPRVASQTRSLSDPATRSERQSQRVSRVRADHHSPRLRRHRL